jgi:YVTN family beta-propeller protein
MTFASCSKDEPEEPPVIIHDPETTGAFILNQGLMGENNSVLSFYNLEEKLLIPGLYRTVNGKGLGDSAEQLLVYGSKTYITVTYSNRLVVLDEAGKEIKSITPAGNQPMNPRRMVAADGKLYVSYYYGHAVAELDTATLEFGRTVAVGRYPEHIAFTGGKLYVANSGGLDYETGYANTVSVIDQATFTLEKEIEVVTNPVRIADDSQGDLYLISMGNYADIPNSLQRIDGKTGAVSTLGNASLFTLVNDKLYTVYAQWGKPEIEFKRYDLLTETVDLERFITDGTTFKAPSAIGVDPLNGTIFIADAEDYKTTGTLYIFSPEGKLQSKEETGGLNPNDIVFIGNYDK